MHRAFRLQFKDDYFSEFYDAGKEVVRRDSAFINRSLAEYLGKNGTLDGGKLQDDWFPEVESDVFICHSHANQNFAILLAGLLEIKFGLRAFVDSSVWGNSANLLKILDEKFSKKDSRKTTYDYAARNRSTAHVHMMLSIALTRMIDRSECVFFLQTRESITSEEAMKTKSPWIFHELSTVNIIRIRPPSDHRKRFYAPTISRKSAGDIEYPVNFDRFSDLSFENFEEWLQQRESSHRINYHPLDLLYGIIPQTEVKAGDW
jgi:hypothetical protein